MRIDNDCVRDILLTVEEFTTYEKAMYIRLRPSNTPERLQKYDIDKSLYHIRNLILANYLYHPLNPSQTAEYEQFVDLTPSGHEFLNTIRSPKIWDETKKLSEKAGAFSLKIISAIAEGVARGAISTHFNIPID